MLFDADRGTGGTRRSAVATPVVQEHPALRREDVGDAIERAATIEHAVDEDDEGIPRSHLHDREVHGRRTLETRAVVRHRVRVTGRRG